MGTTGEFNGHKNGIFFWDLVWEDIRINGIEWEEHGVFCSIKNGGIMENSMGIPWELHADFTMKILGCQVGDLDLIQLMERNHLRQSWPAGKLPINGGV